MILDKGAFNHSASICRDTNTNSELVCWYHGNYECSKDQTVSVALIREGEHLDTIEIDKKSGNAIIFKFKDEIFVLYSRFRKMTRNNIARWQHCVLKASKITIEGNKLESSKPWAISEKIGMLPRCNPIEVNGELKLPLYYEFDNFRGYGVEATLKSTKKRPIVLNEVIKIESKHQMIQPTFYVEDGIIKCLGRNFRPREIGPYAIAASKRDDEWGETVLNEKLYNFNNSIATIQNSEGTTYVMWNHDPNGRGSMTIGIIRGDKLKRLGVMGPASYPNGICDEDGNLHFVMTINKGKNVIYYNVVKSATLNA